MHATERNSRFLFRTRSTPAVQSISAQDQRADQAARQAHNNKVCRTRRFTLTKITLGNAAWMASATDGALSSAIECAYSGIPGVQDVHHSMHADEFDNRADPSGHLKQLQVPALCVQFPEAREKRSESRTVNKAQ